MLTKDPLPPVPLLALALMPPVMLTALVAPGAPVPPAAVVVSNQFAAVAHDPPYGLFQL
jgi:hypothetical protein